MTSTTTYAVATEKEFTETQGSFSPEMRKVLSSVVLSEEVIGDVQQSNIRYVEVPVIEEIINRVPVKSVVEVEKIVPRVEIEYREKYEEKTETHFLDRHVEREITQEVVHEIPGQLEICEVPRTVIKKKPLIKNVVSEKIVEVPGPVVDVTKENVIIEPIKQYHDIEVPVIVAQTIRPVITQYDQYVDVDVVEYEPEIIPVDVYVPTPVESKLVAVGVEQDVHNCVSIPPAQYNTILKTLNQHVKEDQADQLPFIKTNGKIQFLSTDEFPGFVPLDILPQNNEVPNYNKEENYPNENNSGQNTFESKMSQVNYVPEGMNSYNDMDASALFDTDYNRQSSVSVKKPAVTEKKKRTCGC